MITDAFDKTEVLFGPKDFYGEKKHLCDKCIIIFSEVIFEYMLQTYKYEKAGVIKCCNGITTVYIFEITGMKIVGYLSHIGSALAGSDVLDEAAYDFSGLSNANHNMDKLYIAIEIAKRI